MNTQKARDALTKLTEEENNLKIALERINQQKIKLYAENPELQTKELNEGKTMDKTHAEKTRDKEEQERQNKTAGWV